MTTVANGGCSVAISVRDVLLLILEADKYPRLGNEDWPVAALEGRRLKERRRPCRPQRTRQSSSDGCKRFCGRASPLTSAKGSSGPCTTPLSRLIRHERR